jgi:hypothetical protein
MKYYIRHHDSAFSALYAFNVSGVYVEDWFFGVLTVSLIICKGFLSLLLFFIHLDFVTLKVT